MAGVEFLAGTRDFSLLLSIQTNSWNHSASNPMGNGAFLPRNKAVIIRSCSLTFI
jgi:hypothetical protein